MVQFFQQGNPRGALAESLGMNLGQGLGQGLNAFFANKAIDDVTNDPENANLSPAQKLGKLSQALMPYGEMGQQAFQNRMAIEQQQLQDTERAKAEKKEKVKGRALAKFVKGEEILPEEYAMFTPQELAAMQKAYYPEPKSPLGGLGGQPVPAEFANLMEKVIDQNPEANPDELALKMAQAGIPPSYSSPYIENRRRAEENEAKLIETGYKSNEKYLEDTTKGAQAANEMDMRLDQMLTLKDLPTPLLTTTMESLGIPVSLFSSDAETAEKLSIDLTKNIQQFYGNRILQSEFQAFLRSIPSLKNTQEGRERIVENMKRFNDLKRLEYNTARSHELDFESKNKPLPFSFRRQVYDKMKPEAEKLAKQFAEANRRPLEKKPLPEGKIRVKDRSTGKIGTIIPSEGWEKYYESVD